MTHSHFILKGKTILEVDAAAWARWFETAYRTVAWDPVGDVNVSTVFLGIDHNFRLIGPPLLFETMVFGGELDQEQCRYSSWDEAVEGHAAMLARVKETLEPPLDGRRKIHL